MVWKLKIGAVLALIAWWLPLPSLVTPATLFALPNSQITWNQAQVLSLDMSRQKPAKTFHVFSTVKQYRGQY